MDRKSLPRQPKEVRPELDAPIINADRSADALSIKLDTGMTVGQVIDEAALWWEATGRKGMADRNLATDNPAFKSFNPNPTTAEEAENSLPSNILKGKPWVDLTREEKLHVAKVWHHQFVRVRNLDPELYLRAKRRPGVCFYCDEAACASETLPTGEVREMCWPHFMGRYPNEAKAVFEQQAVAGHG